MTRRESPAIEAIGPAVRMAVEIHGLRGAGGFSFFL